MNPSADHADVVIFDGVCHFCDRSVQFVMDRDPNGRFAFAANQSVAGSRLLRQFGKDPADVTSVYLIRNGRIYDRSTAALKIAGRLPFPWKFLAAGLLIPGPLRDLVYAWIARNRYRWFGKAETCRIPTEAERARFLA